jgi:T-complex protein 1 subunit zeta
MTGDGTTSNVLFCGGLLTQSERYLTENLHPRLLVEVCFLFSSPAILVNKLICILSRFTQGFEIAREKTLEFLDKFKVELKEEKIDRSLLTQVAQTSLRTKVCLFGLHCKASLSLSI